MKHERDKSKERTREDKGAQRRSPMPPPSHPIDSGNKHRKDEHLDYDEMLIDEEEANKVPPVGSRPHQIRIIIGSAEATVRLNDSATSQELWHHLPLASLVKRFGDELYCDVPFTCLPEEPQSKVSPGTVAFWAEGDSFCILFGDTPTKPVNVIGALDGEANRFFEAKEGDEIILLRED